MKRNEIRHYYDKPKRKNSIILLISILVIILAVVFMLFVYPNMVANNKGNNNGNNNSSNNSGNDNNSEIIPPNTDDEDKEIKNETGEDSLIDNEEGNTDPSQIEEESNAGEESNSGDNISNRISEATLLAKGYDYKKAIDLLEEVDGYESNPLITEKISTLKEEMDKLVEWPDVTKISHVFFHTLIVDPKKAFDGDYTEDGYNQVMTTVDELNKIMEEMYKRGYVLVSIHDIASYKKQEDGTSKMEKGKIMLPEGKIPFVLSQDDVSYYEYMDGDGFASRLIVDETGKVTNEMILEDKSVVRGSFDVVPLLEDFIKEHPDFSYKGARGILALTGYNGVLGYRTSPSEYKDSETLEEDIITATKVADAIKELGWEFASHGWGHRDLGRIPYKDFLRDTDKWEAEVKPILGATDIILFPFGSDIGTWKPYSGERYEYLKGKGFRYFCNVDAKDAYWVQITDEYVRQGRINLDGMRMYEAISGGKNRVEPFFDVDYVFDKSRPIPVPGM